MLLRKLILYIPTFLERIALYPLYIPTTFKLLYLKAVIDYTILKIYLPKFGFVIKLLYLTRPCVEI